MILCIKVLLCQEFSNLLVLVLMFTLSHFSFFFFFNDTPPPEIYPLPLHAALPIWGRELGPLQRGDRLGEPQAGGPRPDAGARVRRGVAARWGADLRARRWPADQPRGGRGASPQQIGRAHVWTPVTATPPMPPSARQ